MIFVVVAIVDNFFLSGSVVWCHCIAYARVRERSNQIGVHVNRIFKIRDG